MYDKKFKNKFITVEIDSKEGYGYFEIGNTEDDYIEGGLWFEENELVDFDGCYCLPELVRDKLVDLGFKVDIDFIGY